MDSRDAPSPSSTLPEHLTIPLYYCISDPPDPHYTSRNAAESMRCSLSTDQGKRALKLKPRLVL